MVAGLEVFWRHWHVDIPLPNLGELKNLDNLTDSASCQQVWLPMIRLLYVYILYPRPSHAPGFEGLLSRRRWRWLWWWWWWWWFRFVLHAAKEIQAVRRDAWVRHVLMTDARSLCAELGLKRKATHTRCTIPRQSRQNPTANGPKIQSWRKR